MFRPLRRAIFRLVLILSYYQRKLNSIAGPSGRAIQGVGLWPLACCDRGFESYQGHGCLSVVCVVCCQVEVSATNWSFVQEEYYRIGAALSKLRSFGTGGGGVWTPPNLGTSLSRDSSVGLTTRYRGSNLGGAGRDFPHLSRPALKPTQSPIQGALGLSLG
jgi:hypothetical protein